MRKQKEFLEDIWSNKGKLRAVEAALEAEAERKRLEAEAKNGLTCAKRNKNEIRKSGRKKRVNWH